MKYYCLNYFVEIIGWERLELERDWSLLFSSLLIIVIKVFRLQYERKTHGIPLELF